MSAKTMLQAACLYSVLFQDEDAPGVWEEFGDGDEFDHKRFVKSLSPDHREKLKHIHGYLLMHTERATGFALEVVEDTEIEDELMDALRPACKRIKKKVLAELEDAEKQLLGKVRR